MLLKTPATNLATLNLLPRAVLQVHRGPTDVRTYRARRAAQSPLGCDFNSQQHQEQSSASRVQLPGAVAIEAPHEAQSLDSGACLVRTLQCSSLVHRVSGALLPGFLCCT